MMPRMAGAFSHFHVTTWPALKLFRRLPLCAFGVMCWLAAVLVNSELVNLATWPLGKRTLNTWSTGLMLRICSGIPSRMTIEPTVMLCGAYGSFAIISGAVRILGSPVARLFKNASPKVAVALAGVRCIKAFTRLPRFGESTSAIS